MARTPDALPPGFRLVRPDPLPQGFRILPTEEEERRGRAFLGNVEAGARAAGIDVAPLQVAPAPLPVEARREPPRVQPVARPQGPRTYEDLLAEATRVPEAGNASVARAFGMEPGDDNSGVSAQEAINTRLQPNQVRANREAAKDNLSDYAPAPSLATQALDIARSIPAGAFKGLGAGMQGLSDLQEIAERRLGQLRMSIAERIVGRQEAERQEGERNKKPNLTPLLGAARREIGEEFEATGKVMAAPDYRQNDATEVAEGLGQIASQLAVGITTGGTGGVAFLAGQGADSMTDRVKANKKQGTWQGDAATIGGAALTAAIEKTGLDKLLERAPPGVRNGVLRRIFDYGMAGGIEGMTEVAEGIGQDAITKVLLNPNTKVGDDIVQDFKMGGAVGAIARAAIDGATGRNRALDREYQEAEPRPAGVRETVQAQPVNVTPEDIASPLDTTIISEGKRLMDEVRGTRDADAILAENNVPTVGARVRVNYGNRIVDGTVEDAIDTDDGELGRNRGIKIKLDDGTSFDEYFSTIQDSGISIEPIVAPPPAAVPPPVEAAPPPRIAAAPAARRPAEQGDELEIYLAAARGAESGGNDRAANSKSSADGRYQFLDKTFRAYYIKEYGRDPGEKPPSELKFDVEVQERLMRSFTKDNAAYLRKNGVGVDRATLYAAHHFGPAGAVQMGKNPNAAVDADVVKYNPQFRGMTNAQALAWTANHVSKGQGVPRALATVAADGEGYVPTDFTPRDRNDDGGLLDDALPQAMMPADVAPAAVERASLDVPEPVVAEVQDAPPVNAPDLQSENIPPSLDIRPTASWVIRNKASREVIMETFDRRKVNALNTETYEAVPIQEYLGSINGAPARLTGETGAAETQADLPDVPALPEPRSSAAVLTPTPSGKSFTIASASEPEIAAVRAALPETAKLVPNRRGEYLVPVKYEEAVRAALAPPAAVPAETVSEPAAIPIESPATAPSSADVAPAVASPSAPGVPPKPVSEVAPLVTVPEPPASPPVPDFDPEPVLPALRKIVFDTNIPLRDTAAIARNLGVSEPDAVRALGILGSRPGSGMRMTKGSPAKLSKPNMTGRSRVVREAIPPRLVRISGRTAPLTAMDFVRSIGGVQSQRNDLRNVGALARYPGVISSKGRTLDAIGEALWEAGYFVDRDPSDRGQRPTEAETLDFLERASTKRAYVAGDEPEQDTSGDPEEMRAAAERAAESLGLVMDPAEVDDAVRYIDGGIDVDEAVVMAANDAFARAALQSAEESSDAYYEGQEILYGERADDQANRATGGEDAQSVGGYTVVEGNADGGSAPDAEPGGSIEASQVDAFGTRDGDQRVALERAGEGRQRGTAPQRAAGSDGGLFDSADTTGDMFDAPRAAPNPIAQAREALQAAINALDGAAPPVVDAPAEIDVIDETDPTEEAPERVPETADLRVVPMNTAPTADQAEAIRTDLTARLKKIDPRGRFTLKAANGLLDDAQGAYLDRTAYISLDRTRDPVATLIHEIGGHGFYQLGLYTNAEYTVLKAEAEKRGLLEWARANYANRSDEKQREESVSELLARFVRQRADVRGFLATAVQKTADFALAVVDAFRAVLTGSPQARQVMRAVESGAIGARDGNAERRAGGVEATEADFRVEFDDAASETRWQEATKGLGDGPNWIERSRGWWADVAIGFSRHWRALPNEPRFSDLQQQFRKLEAAPEASTEEVVRRLTSMVKGFSKADLDLFTRKVVLDDLQWEADADHKLPFGLNVDSLAAARAKVDAAVAADSKIGDAVLRRKLINKQLADEMVKAGVLTREQIKNPAYYRHMVLDFARNEMKNAKTPGSKIKSPYWAKRMGSSLDINANLLEAEFDWMQKALVDIATANTIEWVKKSKHNIRDELRDRAKASNRALVKALVDADTTKVGEKTKRGEIAQADRAFKQAVSEGMEIVRDQLRRGNLGLIPTHLASASDALANDTKGDSPFALFAWILDNDKPGANGAAMVLKAAGQRKAWEQKLLGDKYLDAEDVKELVKRIGPEGYSAWQPIDGQHLFTVKSISESALDMFVMKLADTTMPGINHDELARALGSIRNQLVIGGDRYTMVLPDEVTDTLNEYGDRRAAGMAGKLFAEIQGAWKRWMLINPRRVLKYNINNLTGDLDAIIAGNPGALRKVGQAGRELYAVMKNKEAPTARYTEAVERGVFTSGLSVQEIPDISRLSALRFLTDKSKRPDKMIVQGAGAVWRALQGFTQWRESVFRYASYLDYIEKIEAGTPMLKIGYGASVPRMVDAVTDPRDKAALLARDLVGDYGSISTAGAWLRRYLIPFWSWTEINTRRYYRLTSNAFTTSAGRGLATGGILGAGIAAQVGVALALRMAAVYGALYLWNNLLFSDEEDELGDMQKRQLHLIVGRDADGKVMTLRTQGALSDVIGMLGFPDAIKGIKNYQDGQGTIGQAVKDALKAPVNRFVGGVSPFIGEPLEQIMGKEMWPDAFKMRDIHDKWRHLFQTVNLENEYDATFGARPIARAIGGEAADRKLDEVGVMREKPSRGYGYSWTESLIYRRDPGEMAYDDNKIRVYNWLEKVKGEGGGSSSTPRSKAMREYRQAVRFGDEEAANRALDEYESLGGTAQSFKQSVKSQHPLGPLSNAEKEEFVDALTDDQYETLMEAEEYYNRVYLPAQ